MTIDTEKLRAETLALIDGTSPGPWKAGSMAWPEQIGCCPLPGRPFEISHNMRNVAAAATPANARLIAAAPTLAADTLRLLDEIERLTAENERMREPLAANAVCGKGAVSETMAWAVVEQDTQPMLKDGYSAVAVGPRPGTWMVRVVEGVHDDR